MSEEGLMMSATMILHANVGLCEEAESPNCMELGPLLWVNMGSVGLTGPKRLEPPLS